MDFIVTTIHLYSSTMQHSIDYVFFQEWTTVWFSKMCKLKHVDLDGLSSNANLTNEIILSNMNFGWNAKHLVRNNCIDIDGIIHHAAQPLKRTLNKFLYLHHEIFENQNTTLQQLLDNPNLMMTFCRKDKNNYNTQLSSLCSNSIHIMKIYDANPKIKFHNEYYQIQFDFKDMSFNKSLTLDFIEKHIDNPWDWECLSAHPSITPDFVQRHRDKPWTIYGVEQNCNFTIKDLFRLYPNYHFDMGDYCHNPNITFDEIDNFIASSYSDETFCPAICYNPLTREKNTFINNMWLRLLLSSIHEFHCLPNTYKMGDAITNIECIFADNFLVSLIIKY